MNVVSNLHWIIIEISAVRFVRWPIGKDIVRDAYPMEPNVSKPHDATIPNQTVSAQGYDYCMSWASSPEVTSDDCTARYDRLATEDNVLWSCDSGSSRNLVTCILSICPDDILFNNSGLVRTVSMNSAFE